MIEDAQYAPHLDINLNNNPLSEALRVELYTSTLLEKLTVNADVMANFWELPLFYQTTQLRQLTEIHIPASQTYFLYNKIMSLILFGYVKRNPFSAQMRGLGDKIAAAMRAGKYYGFSSESTYTAPSALVHGESGTGKTTVIRRTLKQIPQTIQHNSYRGKHFTKKQIVWLSFDLPPNGSPKAMVNNFIRAVDKALENDFEESYAKQWVDGNGKYSVDKLMAVMQNIAMQHCVGLVHIDELQFMLGYHKVKDSPSLQVLEALFNKISIPLLLSSTTRGVEIFNTLKADDHRLGHDITIVRRMLNDREFRLSPYPLESKSFERLFDALFPPGIILNDDTEQRDVFTKQFHKLSCGLPAIMTRLAHQFHETLVNILQQPENRHKYTTSFDVELLNKVFKNQFHLIEPALVALRAGNAATYESKVRDNDVKKAVYSNAEVQALEKAKRTQLSPQPKVLKFDDAPQEGIGLIESAFLKDKQK
ncbi:ATP-binding protein [Alteromonas sp. ALT199]|uniref:ATP-binding protein n=1 Tax=unclassified Alteromonas TaxID=2614992 RepID=UPI001BE908B9|nr:ATP-binding protein [Alteromonas sp. ALT199]MBT3136329.1 ATP-binding protein [Alteromonas sp. ALT199]